MKFFKCPCCTKLHFERINGITYENPYKTLQDFTITKRLKCSKCMNNLAVLIHNTSSDTKIIWEDYYKVYDDGFEKQQILQAEKEKALEIDNDQDRQKKIDSILKQFRDLQNQVSTSQSKLRIKSRVISPETSIGMSERLNNI